MELMARGEFAKAGGVLEPFFQENPRDVKVTVEYAASFLGRGQPARAEEILEAVAADGAAGLSDAGLLYQMAECKLLLGKLAEAETWYRRLAETTASPQLKSHAAQRLQQMGK